jgi:glycosyltransferase involved in cell wall biosynthesis
VTTSFPTRKGNYRGTFILDLAKALQKHGVIVRVITTHNPGTKKREVLEGVEVIRPQYLWPEKLEILQQVSGGLPEMWRKNYLTRFIIWPYLVRMGLAIAQYARDFDVIHAQWTLSAALAYATHFYHKRPYLVTVHGSDIYQAAQIPIFREITKRILNHSDQIIAISHSMAEETSKLGIPPENIRLLPNGVNTNFFHPPEKPREKLAVFAGSLIARKGVQPLLEAVPKLIQAKPDYKLVIVGDGPKREEMQQIVHSKGLEDSIDLTGAQTPDEVREWMQRAKIFVLPSLEEGMGVVLLEALACGTPCVATKVGGIPDVINDRVGLLVPANDSQALAMAMIRLIDDTKLWETMNKNAPKLAREKYSEDKQVVELVKMYREVLKG